MYPFHMGRRIASLGLHSLSQLCSGLTRLHRARDSIRWIVYPVINVLVIDALAGFGSNLLFCPGFGMRSVAMLL